MVPADARARARIEQREPGVISGLDVAREAFTPGRSGLRSSARGGGGLAGGGEVAAIEGPPRRSSPAERVALNFLGRLSGVATLTARYVSAVEGTGARILDTRKTTPGLRALEKRAVLAGGGVSTAAASTTRSS